MTERGLSERRALTILGMSASALRYAPAPDRNRDLRTRIVALAQRHRRYGAGKIYLQLRQAGTRVNHKRVDRLYAAGRLQIRRRRRKKVPVAVRGTTVGTPLHRGLSGRSSVRSATHTARPDRARRRGPLDADEVACNRWRGVGSRAGRSASILDLP